MQDPRRVVWYEGMFLAPHHFQQWDRYHTTLLQERLRMLQPFGWGIFRLDLDTEGLANGHVALLGLHAVFPDGLVVQVPDRDPPPETRSLEEWFPANLPQLDVFIGIPVVHPGSAACTLGDGRPSRPVRFRAETIKVTDENTGENPREVTVAQPNLRILFQGEDFSDYLTLKIAELIRTPGGTITLREAFVPPCVTTSASPYLLRLIRGLVDRMSARARALRRQLQAPGVHRPEDRGLLQVLNTYLPVLNHVQRTGHLHPEALYLLLVQLAGALSAFPSRGTPEEIPPYEHTRLGACFEALDHHLQGLLEGVETVRSEAIPLERVREHLWVARFPDPAPLTTHQFYLGVQGGMPAEGLRTLIPRRLKVGSAQDIDLILTTAMPGVQVHHTPYPPGGLPPLEGGQYFRLENQGEFWDSVCRTHSLAVYVPPDLQGLSLSLVALKETAT